jgi:Flp pilus assembly pilin Flp
MTVWKKLTTRFRREEDGAVTVDWVMVTAAVALLSIPVLTTIKASVQTGTDTVAADMEAAVD